MYDVQILACIMCRFEHVLCAIFSTSYVSIYRELALLAWLALLALRPCSVRTYILILMLSLTRFALFKTDAIANQICLFFD